VRRQLADTKSVIAVCTLAHHKHTATEVRDSAINRSQDEASYTAAKLQWMQLHKNIKRGLYAVVTFTPTHLMLAKFLF
jgi:hypothetical protein